MEEPVQALSRAQVELKFVPSPATLREYSGRAVAGERFRKEPGQTELRLNEFREQTFRQPALGPFFESFFAVVIS